MSEERLDALERRIDQFGGTVLRVDHKLDGIAQTLNSLARIEERQVNTNEKLTAGAAKMNDHETRIRNLEIQMPDNADKRLSAIETKMPGLVESRKWVVMGILAGIAMIGAGIVKLVFIK